MALGTITTVRGADYISGNKKVKVRDIQLSAGANYTTGGETVTAAAVGLRRIEQANVLALAGTSDGATSRSVVVLYSASATSVKLVVQTTGSAEAANNSNQSTYSVRIAFTGV